jgi:hypothetical protein
MGHNFKYYHGNHCQCLLIVHCANIYRSAQLWFATTVGSNISNQHTQTDNYMTTAILMLCGPPVDHYIGVLDYGQSSTHQCPFRGSEKCSLNHSWVLQTQACQTSHQNSQDMELNITEVFRKQPRRLFTVAVLNVLSKRWHKAQEPKFWVPDQPCD